MRGDRMYQLRENFGLRRSGPRQSILYRGRSRVPRCCGLQKGCRATYLAVVFLLVCTTHPLLAQEKSPEPVTRSNPDFSALLQSQPQMPASSAKRPITISDAVSIFLQQNFLLVAA